MHWSVRASLFFVCIFPSTLMADIQHREPQQQYRVAILDRFFPPVEGFSSSEQRDLHLALYGMVDIDDDDQNEPLYHGDLVRLLASNNQINFITYPIQNNRAPMSDILVNLRKINTRLSVQPVNALILSWESSTLVSTFGSVLETRLAESYKQTVKQMGETSEVWRDTYLIILELEKLVNNGVMVYTIAGNGGRNMVNTFSFAKGVIAVGASEIELENYIANNAFVDTYAQAAYQLVRVDDSKGQPLGYDLNDDRCIDIPLNLLTSYKNNGDYPKTFWKVLRGSSFAAPTALKLELIKNLQVSC